MYTELELQKKLLELMKRQLDQLTTVASKAFDLSMESFTCGVHSCKENEVRYRKANEAFMGSIDEMRKLIVKGYDLC